MEGREKGEEGGRDLNMSELWPLAEPTESKNMDLGFELQRIHPTHARGLSRI